MFYWQPAWHASSIQKKMLYKHDTNKLMRPTIQVLAKINFSARFSLSFSHVTQRPALNTFLTLITKLTQDQLSSEKSHTLLGLNCMSSAQPLWTKAYEAFDNSQLSLRFRTWMGQGAFITTPKVSLRKVCYRNTSAYLQNIFNFHWERVPYFNQHFL